MPRWSLLSLCLPTAGLLGFGAVVLPWQRMTAFALVTFALAALHALVALLAAARPAALRRPLRALGFASLLYLAWIAQQVTGSALYVAEIYGSLGKGVAAGMGAFVGLTALLTLPIGLWALALTRPSEKPKTPWAWIIGGSALLAFALASGATWAQARAPRLPLPPDPLAAVQPMLPDLAQLPELPRRAPLFVDAPLECAAAPGPGAMTLGLVYADRKGRVRAVCMQGGVDVVMKTAREQLEAFAARGPIKLDWVRSALPLAEHPGLLGPLVDVLALRPGLDGVCHGSRCLMPWQLVATGAFAAREATPYIPKMRLGFAVRGVRALLGANKDESIAGLSRITTTSILVDEHGEARVLRRMRDLNVQASAQAVAAGELAAEDFVLRAQRRDGTYRYQLDAFRDTSIQDNPSIPRHAGTTLVLCELGRDTPEVQTAIVRALAAQAGYQRRFGELAALTYLPRHRHGDLGSSALGLVAFTACRERAGDTHDALIGRLARFLMSMQRDDGSFRPGQDLRRKRKLEGPTPMFAAGQVIMGLTQLEEILHGLPEAERAPFPPLSEVHDAVERAMDHVAGAYWPAPLGQFFYLKENWHCLAARAALRSHRHDGYERFCIDYAEFKSRLLLEPGDDVDPELVGGYGFGNIVPPHVGSSGGLGEVLGAAVTIKQARGEDDSALRARLQLALTYLLRNQSTADSCFACRTDHASGFFPGFMVGPWGRIDHIQHPWSALGHGARALGWRGG